MSGTFGLELDPARQKEEEIGELRRYIGIFRRYAGLIRTGVYSRLRPKKKTDSLFAWEIRSEDASEALLFAADTDLQSNAKAITWVLTGLQEQSLYRLTCVEPEGFMAGGKQLSGQIYTGTELMRGAFSTAPFSGSVPAALFYFERVDQL
jgi:alpha-galactosidase